MIKQGVKNFFVNLKYFFTPLGMIALGFVFGLSVLIPGIAASVQTLMQNIQTALSGANVDFSALQDSVFSAVQALDWNNPLAALETMLNAEWLTRTLHACLNALIESSEIYTEPINAAVGEFMTNVIAYFVVLCVFTLLGVIGGYYLTKKLVRHNIAKRAWWKYFLHSFLDSLLTAALTALCVWLITVWKPSVFITAFLSVILYGFISLFEAYIIHAWKKVDVKEAVNGKNILQLVATNLIIFLLAAVFISIATAITNAFVGLFMGVAVAEIAFVVISLNAESYVKSLAEKTL